MAQREPLTDNRKRCESSVRSNVGVRSAALLVCLAAAVGGCGGSSAKSSDELPPAPEPAKSPPARERPAGRVVPVGNKPEGLAFDSRTGLLAVGLAQPDRLALMNGRSGRVVRRVRLGESPRHLQLAAPGGPVLVPAEKSNELIEVSLPGGRATSSRTGRFPHDAARANGRTFVADELADTVSVLEAGRRTKVFKAPVQPGAVEVTGDGRLLGAVGVRGRQLELFDTRALRSLGRLDAGVGPTHLVALGRSFFVVDTRGNSVLEVAVDPELVVRRRTRVNGRPYGVAVDRRRKRLWITLTERNELVELSTRKRVRVLPTVRQPNTVAVDERSGRVFVTGKVDGTVQIIDP